MTIVNPASLIDHTLLAPTATVDQVVSLCEEAVEFGFASVCIPPVYVPAAARGLYGSDVKVCTVVGFPCGYSLSESKVQETTDLISAGAEEIDMVIQIGHLITGNEHYVEDEIAAVVAAAGDVPVKVIIECAWLSREQKIRAAEMVVKAGAAFVKTSTGFAPTGATLDDVRLLAEVVVGRIGIKAAGGIRTLETCLDFIHSGATRIGSSSGTAIVQQWHETMFEQG